MADVAEDSTDAVSDAGGVHVERLQCAGDPSWRIVYGGMDVQGQSVAGISTCISVKTNGTHLAFDMGSCPSFAVGAQFVFITHGHPDHCAGVVQHIARRALVGAKPATYFMPSIMVPCMEQAVAAFREMSGADMPCTIVALHAPDTADLKRGLRVQALRTTHRVRSQAYVLVRRRKTLRADLVGLPREEVGARAREGECVTQDSETPVFAFSGDCIMDSILEHEVLLSVPVLVMELTFADESKTVLFARERGHVHVDEVAEHADRFKNQLIIFTHLSARHAVESVEAAVLGKLPEALRGRVCVGR